MNIQHEYQLIFESIPIPGSFLTINENTPIVYGYGGCGGVHLNLSPSPVCVPIFPKVSTPPPTVIEPPPPWNPPPGGGEPPGTVPIPGTALLLALGIALLWARRKR